MKFLFDLFPVILFFITFKVTGDIFKATIVVIVATAVQVAWVWIRHRKVEKMLLASLILVVILGGATVLFRNETFIKWKPTTLYWLFAGVLLVAEFLFHKNLIRTMLEQQVQLPNVVWRKLNLSWIIFFIFMGIANIYVAYNFSTEIWVDFKLFGGIGLMLLFVILQGLMLAKYIENKEIK